MQTPPKTVAVVVPLSNREELTPDEAISLRHLVHFLGKYDKFLVVPQNLKVNYPGFGIQRFPHKFFGSAAAHMQLMLSRKFYQTFRNMNISCFIISMPWFSQISSCNGVKQT